MENELARFRGIIDKYADIRRGWHYAQVVDSSAWSSTGEGYVTLNISGYPQLAVYRDGPEPTVGGYLQVQRMRAEGHSYWLALPLPEDFERPTTCIDAYFFVVGRVAGGSTYRILKFTSIDGLGDRWFDVSACPAAAIGDEEPQLYAAFTSNQYTWSTYYGFPDGVSSLDDSYFSYRFFCYTRGGELFYSDDLCVTWIGTGLTIAHLCDAHYNSLFYAVSSSALHVSQDFGATWVAVPDSGPPAGEWIFVSNPAEVFGNNDYEGNAANFRTSEGSPFERGANPNPDHLYRENAVTLCSTEGVYGTINFFTHYTYPLVADPPFDATDAGQFGIVYPDSGVRPWFNRGSDDGHWTDTGGFTTNYPWVTTKEYRDSYGPYVGPTDARHFFTGANNIDNTSAVEYMVEGQVYSFTFTGKAMGLPARGDPYDGSIKDPGIAIIDWSYFTSESHWHGPAFCFDSSPVGGVALTGAGTNAYWTCNYNHPHYLNNLGLLDMARWQGGAFPSFRECNLVGIDDEEEGGDHCSFAVWSDYFPTTYGGTTPTGGYVNSARSLDASVTMRHDLGEYYVTTRHGIAQFNLGWWY